MTDHPIIFSAPMIRALLGGRKTQTRRLAWRDDPDQQADPRPTPWQRVQVGDRLWTRESLECDQCNWRYWTDATPLRGSSVAAEWADRQRRDNITAIHMPRWASRMTLAVIAVKIRKYTRMPLKIGSLICGSTCTASNRGNQTPKSSSFPFAS